MKGGEFSHRPVMMDEALKGLEVRAGGIYLDATMGGAGHSQAILQQSAPDGRLLAIDRDAEAIAVGMQRLAPYGDRVSIIRSNFDEMDSASAGFTAEGFDGILMDIGCSSPQLDNAERGFSYMNDGALDMRMDRRQKLTAAQIVNTYSKEKLEAIFWRYGEEKWARRIALFIVEARSSRAIETTSQLVEIIKQAVPVGAREKDQHLAKRVFQALRIAVNDELGALEKALDAALSILRPGGRLAVITFHSLEDRIVKEKFKYFAADCVCPPGLPICTCGKVVMAKIVNRKPLLPSDEEIGENPRARSAKLRLCQKV